MFANTLGVARKYGSKLSAAGAGLMLAPFARAEVPADILAELNKLKPDGMTMAGIVLLAIIAIFAIKFLRKGI